MKLLKLLLTQVTHKTLQIILSFFRQNDNSQGELVNETYVARAAGTHAKPDGTGTIEVENGEVTDSEGIVAPTPTDNQ